MVVHEVCASKEFLKVVVADVKGNGKSDGRPQGVPTPNPVPEPKHVGFINAKCLHLGSIGGQRYKVFGYGFRLGGRGKEL